jgi:hypothetical protein
MATFFQRSLDQVDTGFVTKMSVGDIMKKWTLRDVFQIATKDDVKRGPCITKEQQMMFAMCNKFKHNVTGEVVDLVGQFIGESRRRGNYIAGTQNFLPQRLELLQALIWEHHMTLCLSSGKSFSLPINDATRIHMNHSVAIWQSWLRLPGQEWCFLKDDSQTWKEIMEGEQSLCLRMFSQPLKQH